MNVTQMKADRVKVEITSHGHTTTLVLCNASLTWEYEAEVAETHPPEGHEGIVWREPTGYVGIKLAAYGAREQP